MCDWFPLFYEYDFHLDGLTEEEVVKQEAVVEQEEVALVYEETEPTETTKFFNDDNRIILLNWIPSHLIKSFFREYVR